MITLMFKNLLLFFKKKFCLAGTSEVIFQKFGSIIDHLNNNKLIKTTSFASNIFSREQWHIGFKFKKPISISHLS